MLMAVSPPHAVADAAAAVVQALSFSFALTQKHEVRVECAVWPGGVPVSWVMYMIRKSIWLPL